MLTTPITPKNDDDIDPMLSDEFKTVLKEKQNCYGNLDKILSSLNYWGLLLLAAFTLWTCSDSDWEILLYYFEKFVHFWKRQLSLIIISSSHYRTTFESKKHIFARKFIEGKIDLLRNCMKKNILIEKAYPIANIQYRDRNQPYQLLIETFNV